MIMSVSTLTIGERRGDARQLGELVHWFGLSCLDGFWVAPLYQA
jgi:hypothetical protein